MSVDFSVKGKVAIVTGGSKGIGRAIALALAEHGADVTISARGEDALASTKREIEALGRRCLVVQANLANEDDWKRLVDETIAKFGGVDILVNNAAVDSGYAPAEKTDLKRWDLVMKVNLKAPFALSVLCLPSMRARGGGSIIHITSNEGLRPTYGMCAYSVSKGALITLTQQNGKEWAPSRVRVNCIAPGLVQTEMAAPLVDMFLKQGKLPNPMQHVAVPDDIAGIALYLASDAGRYATGQNFTIDGGEMVLSPTDQL
jgi:dehydrogenase/reductase SDR family member 4